MVNLKQLIAETFSVDASVIADDLKYQGIPQWDSVGHMNLIAALEDAFDLMLDMDDVPEYWTHYFVGVPAPAAAGLGIMPVLIWFDFPELEWLLRSNAFCAIMTCLVTFLMVSRIPTISLKKTKVKTSMFVPLMLIVVLFVNFMLTQPWMTLGVIGCLYLISIPLSCLKFLKDKKKYEQKKKA